MSARIHFDGAAEPPEAFAARCDRAAAALHELGIGPGRVIALMLHNEPIVLELMLAARAIGAHYCLVNWHFKAAEVRHILSDSEARVLIVHRHLLEQIRAGIPETVRVFVAEPHARTRSAFQIAEARPELAADRQSWQIARDRLGSGSRALVPPAAPGSAMVYTSGTTGLPKGIRRAPASAEQLQRLAETARIAIGIEPGMRALVSAPLYHSAPAQYVLQAALKDAEIWIEPRFDAEATLRIIERERITHAYLVPTMFTRLLRLAAEIRSRYSVGSLRFVACTGAPFPQGTKARMIEWWGPVLHESYAASELGWVTHIDSREAERKPGSVGRPIAGVTVKILAEDGTELPRGSAGLVHARSAAVPDFTYANNDEARRKLEHDGLWTLRDVGYLDEDGYLYLVDRLSDMVISGGVNIYPAEIEAALATLPGVVDCAVFGVPDEEFGEALVAAVQPADDASLTPELVRAFLRERLAGYKVPRTVVFRSDLPREETGKIFKRKLRDLHLAALRAAAVP
jgi:long-chain acyl-CoA synthetase